MALLPRSWVQWVRWLRWIMECSHSKRVSTSCFLMSRESDFGQGCHKLYLISSLPPPPATPHQARQPGHLQWKGSLQDWGTSHRGRRGVCRWWRTNLGWRVRPTRTGSARATSTLTDTSFYWPGSLSQGPSLGPKGQVGLMAPISWALGFGSLKSQGGIAYIFSIH